MYIPETFAASLGLMLLSMLCWGSWANAFSMARGQYRFELFYWDYAVGVMLGMLVLASVFRFVPNTHVRRRDAIAGGLIASIAFELGKRGFAAYLLKVPTYKAVYGAFAAFPVFLLWVYFSWLVTLLSRGATVVLRHADDPIAQFLGPNVFLIGGCTLF